MANFMGKDGFIWWQGVVEDRHDPLFLGRCRIRILGWHTKDKSQIPTESLPWAFPIQPITSAAQTGVGISPTGVVEGTWVVGFFRDGEDGQEPVFFGTLGGIPDVQSNMDLYQDAQLRPGFQDPRNVDAPELHPVIKMKGQKLLRYGRDAAGLVYDNVPREPKNISHKKLLGAQNLAKNTQKPLPANWRVGGTPKGVSNDPPRFEIVIEEQETRSPFPDKNYLDEPTTPRLARGDFGNFAATSPLGSSSGYFGIIGQKLKWKDVLGPIKTASGEEWQEPKPYYAAKYPYNHVHQSESGHIIEIDDTPGNERLHRFHRAGTFEEIGPLGQRIMKVANENYHIVLSNSYERVEGTKYISCAGDFDIDCSEMTIKTKQPLIMKGQWGMGAVTIGTHTTIEGKTINLNAKTNVNIKGKTLNFNVSDVSFEKIDGFSVDSPLGRVAFMGMGIELGSLGKVGISGGTEIGMMATESIKQSITGLTSVPGSGLYVAETNVVKGDIGLTTLAGAIDLKGGLAHNGTLGIGLGGSISLSSLFGLATIEVGLTSIALQYGASSITLDSTGVTISGGVISIEGLNTEVKATAALTLEATGVNTIKGATVMIN